MILQYNLVVSLIIVVSVIEDAHLLQSLLVPLHLLLTPILQNVAFYLLFAVLAQIVDFVAVSLHLQSLVVV
jgi:hypothetical protein